MMLTTTTRKEEQEALFHVYKLQNLGPKVSCFTLKKLKNQDNEMGKTNYRKENRLIAQLCEQMPS